jgi:hypothetical protein
VTMLTNIKVCSSYKAQLCGEWAVMEADRQWSLIFSAFHQSMILHQNVMQSSFRVKYSRIGGKFCSLPTVKAPPITRNTLHTVEKNHKRKHLKILHPLQGLLYTVEKNYKRKHL